METVNKEISYQKLTVRYKEMYFKNIKEIVVYFGSLPVAVDLLQFLELVAVFEGFLANQLPPKKKDTQ